MKSPRFEIRAAKLETLLQAKKLEQVWKKKVRIRMREQHLSDPIEYYDLHINIKTVTEKLNSKILSADYTPSSAHRILSEKSKGLCRQIVLPQPEDAIILQCLSDALYSEIKGKAPTSKSFFEPQDHAFSTHPKGYGTFASWLNFQKELFKFSANRKYIISTDIANYYDSIEYTHLRNAISGIADVSESVLDMILYILSELLWQPDYMPRVEVGLPQIDLDAPRLLAHCFLYDLDEFLDKKPPGDFVRFMDDIDVGVDTLQAAKNTLRDIDLILQTRQLRLNAGKTKILTRLEAARHFRISENMELDQIEEVMDIKRAFGHNVSYEKSRLSFLFHDGIKRKSFDDGNGEKILKRIISICGRNEIRLDLNALQKVLLLRPSVRENVYKYISRKPITLPRIKMLSEFAASGLLVDHVSYIELVKSIVQTRAISFKDISSYLLDISDTILPDGYFGFYGSIWLLSKYGDSKNIFDILEDRKKMWSADWRLGRLVGGLSPLFHKSTNWDEYMRLIADSRNEGARSTFKFHSLLRTDLKTFNKMSPSLRAPNFTIPTGITHPKFLCLLSAISNPSVAPMQIKNMISINKVAWTDIYYKKLGSLVSKFVP